MAVCIEKDTVLLITISCIFNYKNSQFTSWLFREKNQKNSIGNMNRLHWVVAR